MAKFQNMFHTQLVSMLRQRVTLNAGTGFAITGELMEVRSDYVVVQTKDIPELLVPLDHVHCIGLTTESDY